MMEQIFIIGGSNEALNTAIVMASLDRKVTVICSQKQIQDTLQHYCFERQMVSLWHLYTKEQKIQINEEVSATLGQIKNDETFLSATFWLFLDTLDINDRQPILGAINHPNCKTVLSGVCDIGAADNMAAALATPYVFYLPFIFIKDGMNFSSLLQPEFVVLGEKTPNSYLECDAVSFFVNQSQQNHVTDIKTAEFSRNTIMTMLATRLSLMNELSRLADQLNVDITQVENIVGKDPRIGKDYLSAGWGFGGKTLPNELLRLTHTFQQCNIKSSLIQKVMAINEDQKELIFRKFWRHFDGFIEHKTVVIWGAGYRSGTGRTTNSAIHPLLKLLWSYQIKTLIFATNTAFELQEHYSGEPLFELIQDSYQYLPQADALFIINVSAHYSLNVNLLNQANVPIFDAKNFVNNENKIRLTTAYYGIGR
jgi:UDPglucose 6-dehydrogenase